VTAVPKLLALLFAMSVATPALAADLCRQASASHSLAYLLAEKSGGIVQMTRPATIAADVKAFVVKSDETFQDQDFEIFPLGTGGAGVAVHYEGTLAEQYSFGFDRNGGKLRAVDLPNLNPNARDYRETKAAIIAGVPALFSNDEGDDGKTIIRIVPWLGHGWGTICEIETPTPAVPKPAP
jgi:hypothetical protein